MQQQKAGSLSGLGPASLACLLACRGLEKRRGSEGGRGNKRRKLPANDDGDNALKHVGCSEQRNWREQTRLCTSRLNRMRQGPRPNSRHPHHHALPRQLHLPPLVVPDHFQVILYLPISYQKNKDIMKKGKSSELARSSQTLSAVGAEGCCSSLSSSSPPPLPSRSPSRP
jgi:hypothetical protein